MTEVGVERLQMRSERSYGRVLGAKVVRMGNLEGEWKSSKEAL